MNPWRKLCWLTWMDLDCFLTIFLFISEDFRFQKKSSVLDKTKMKHNKMKHNQMKINHCQKTPRDHWKQKNAKEKTPDLLAFCFPNPQLLVWCSPVGGDVNFYFVPGLFWSILLWPRSVARVKTFTLAENISWDNFSLAQHPCRLFLVLLRAWLAHLHTAFGSLPTRSYSKGLIPI